MSVKLTFFEARGRGEIVRMALAQAGLQYTDHRITFDQWKDLKMTDKFPLHQLPILEIDGKLLAQSRSIAKYIAREYGLYGKNNYENYQVDMISDTLEDIFLSIFRQRFEPDAIKTEMKRKAAEVVPKNMACLEEILTSNNGGNTFFVGNKVTLADLHFYCVAETVSGDIESFDLTNYPKLHALYQRVAELPNIAAWLKKRPDTGF